MLSLNDLVLINYFFNNMSYICQVITRNAFTGTVIQEYI